MKRSCTISGIKDPVSDSANPLMITGQLAPKGTKDVIPATTKSACQKGYLLMLLPTDPPGTSMSTRVVEDCRLEEKQDNSHSFNRHTRLLGAGEAVSRIANPLMVPAAHLDRITGIIPPATAAR
jgi:hypothetical protein